MTDHIATIDRALAAWSAHDLDSYLKLYAPGAEVHGLGPVPVGIPAMRAFYETILAAFPDMTLQRLDAMRDGDRVAFRYRVSGTHSGPFQGAPASGASVVADGITILRFEGDHVVERWNAFDLFGLLAQIGAVPAG